MLSVDIALGCVAALVLLSFAQLKIAWKGAEDGVWPPGVLQQ